MGAWSLALREERINWVGIKQIERDLFTGNVVRFSLKKKMLKSLRNLVFTSQRNTTQKCRLIIEN